MQPSMMVKMKTDAYKSEGVYAGDVGVIRELVDGKARVEFSDTYGYTIAALLLSAEEVEVIE